MPLFGFLSIPDNLKKQFTIPKGCVITAESIRLRSVKTLGGNKRFPILKPGGMKSFMPMQPIGAAAEDDEDGAEEIPTGNLPPFEPLVLWREKRDTAALPALSEGDSQVAGEEENPPHKIEVIPQLASKLRPHQREGVAFLFECTMGLRGFEGNGCILADDVRSPPLSLSLLLLTLLQIFLICLLPSTTPSTLRWASARR